VFPTPIVLEGKNGKENKGKRPFSYREAIGCLQQISCKTRPHTRIAFSVNFESRAQDKPEHEDFQNAKRTFSYLNGTRKEGIKYYASNTEDIIIAYSDSDYAGDSKNRKSTTGYVMMYAGGPITWCSRKQSITALSTTEAEYIAAATCCKEIQFIKSILSELLDKDRIFFNFY
jgi:hypothetical protein